MRIGDARDRRLGSETEAWRSVVCGGRSAGHGSQEGQRFFRHAGGETCFFPECDRQLACYDHTKSLKWRHLDTRQFATILHARRPHVYCPDHGVKQVELPWAEKYSRFSLLFERLAIDGLPATRTVKRACCLPGIS